MSPEDSRAALFAAELQSDWTAVETQLARAEGVDPRTGAPQAALVALSLDHAYQAFESLLLRVGSGLDLPRPTGSDWHIRLLEQAALDVPGLRPALYPPGAAQAWHALLRFRHFLRHAYTAELDPDELRRHVARLQTAVALTAPGIRALVEALRPGAAGGGA